jgi:hypothetical protein
VVLRGNNLEIRLGLVIWSNFHWNHLQMTNWYPHSKDNKQPTYDQYTYLNQINSQILKPLLCKFLGNFATWGSGAIIARLLHNLHPPTHVQLKIPVIDFYDTLCLNCMQIFRSIINITNVVVHGRGGTFFNGINYHPVINKKHRSSMYVCERLIYDGVSTTFLFKTRGYKLYVGTSCELTCWTTIYLIPSYVDHMGFLNQVNPKINHE